MSAGLRWGAPAVSLFHSHLPPPDLGWLLAPALTTALTREVTRPLQASSSLCVRWAKDGLPGDFRGGDSQAQGLPQATHSITPSELQE